ncbi:unnamed protein product [Phytophthora lilii]|uniref:Unnamed protein product n=1 Tax=Phytophthora lilii TaxID=2077276 RepID=A0A9W6U113_9STRA|nr:unnamed protein product [Phytophthora lilii]
MDEATMQQMGPAQQLFASINAMMREQQQFLAQTAELQRQMAATLQQQQQPAVQPQGTSELDNREYRAEGIKMPTFAGTKEDDVDDYMFSAKLYFESKNIKYEGTALQQRPLSLLVANLKGPAAVWYREYVSHDGNFLQSVTQFEELLTAEFTAPDRQEHLRDQLLRLRQKNFSCLEDYVSAFRGIICKVQDMSAIDQVMHFQKGLLVEIRQEVKLRQFRNTTEAISFALMYDRTHNVGSHGQNKEQASRRIKDSAASIIHRLQSKNQRRWRLAALDCRKRQTRSTSRGPARPAVGQSSFRTNQSSFRRVVEDDDAEEEEEDDTVELLQSMQLNMVAVQNPSTEARGLLRVNGLMNGQSIRILIDSGAERNIVRPGLAQHFVDAAKVIAERFDGTTTPARTALRCVETLRFADQVFAEVPLIEWEVSVNQDVILGHPWLVQFNPSIDWHTGVMRFREQRKVVDYRAINHSHPVKQPVEVPVVSPEFLQHPMPQDLRQQLNEHVEAGYFHMPLGPSSMFALRCTPPSQVVGKKNDDDEYASLCVLSAEKFESKVKAREYVELFHVTVKTSPKVKTVARELQPVLKEFADVFPKELPSQLPPQRSIEHEVVLKPGASRKGAQPSNRAPFRLSKVEQEALEIFVADLLKKNWIQVSDSPWVSNIFGVPKKDPVTGKFPSRLEWLHSNNPHMPIRWVIDYRLVNAASEVAKIPLPHIEELFDQMEGATVFSILDLASGYHQMRMSPTSKQFTAFRTNHEIYEWNVAPMGLAGLHVDARKTRAIAEWPAPRNVQELQRFLGHAGYYRRFIHGFAQLLLPLSSLVKKDVVWVWGEPQQLAFSSVKLALQQAPVLRLPDFDKPFVVTTDASHNCVGTLSLSTLKR